MMENNQNQSVRRPVEVKEWIKCDGETRSTLKVVGQGLFHQFGTDHMEYDNGPGPFPGAIVEMPDGTVKFLALQQIRFLDKVIEAGYD